MTGPTARDGGIVVDDGGRPVTDDGGRPVLRQPDTDALVLDDLGTPPLGTPTATGTDSPPAEPAAPLPLASPVVEVAEPAAEQA